MTIIRTRYQTIEFDGIDIHLCSLRDANQFSDPDGVAEKLGISPSFWPVFGVVWPSSMVLAHHMHGLHTGTLRILEVGCGIALASHLLNQRNADITATDIHPEVEGFLRQNTLLNEGNEIGFERLDWADDKDTLGKFDLIIGSDLLYEDHQIAILAKFVDAHANPSCDFIMVDPGRGRKNKLRVKMEALGYTCTESKPELTPYLAAAFKGHILTYSRKA